MHCKIIQLNFSNPFNISNSFAIRMLASTLLRAKMKTFGKKKMNTMRLEFS